MKYGKGISFLTVLILIFTASSFYAGSRGSHENIVDADIPSSSFNGTIAIRMFVPEYARYHNGTPVIIHVPGADTSGVMHNPYIQDMNVLLITFLFPGGVDAHTGRKSDGVYDHRGMNCISALRDVIMYAAGKIADVNGKKIDDVISMPVLHNNIGLIGVSNGGNIVIATPAIYGKEMKGYLRYVIQWESPVSSQIATVDLGPIRKNCSPNNFVNPRYISYNPMFLEVNFDDIEYNESQEVKIFHDGNGDGKYTTITDPATGMPTPDLNLNGVLEMNEDFPLSAYTDGVKDIYSRPVTHALENKGILPHWPSDIANVEGADKYWDIREAVRLYDDALRNIPDLKGMILASVEDHVQSLMDKPHIHQAFDGWNNTDAWVKINPSPSYVAEVDPKFEGFELPDNAPNTPPENWSIHDYCMPEKIPDRVYMTAAIYEMADRVYYNRWSSLKISDIRGGFGARAVIRNTGVIEAKNVQWSVRIDGIVMYGRYAEGTIPSISPHQEVIVGINSTFGIGPAEIVVMADENVKAQRCFIIGPYILLL